MTQQPIIGVLGGTFDPVHKGHLHVINACLQTFDLAKLIVIPCRQSPHRPPPTVSSQDRYAMLTLATHNMPTVEVSDLAMHRPSPSYTVDSLAVLRAQYPETPLAFIMGQDVFRQFNRWLHWQKILSFAHLIIVNRPGNQTNDAPWQTQLYEAHETTALNDLKIHLANQIYRLTITPYPISATHIRQALKEKQAVIPELTDAVHQYIVQHGLYR